MNKRNISIIISLIILFCMGLFVKCSMAGGIGYVQVEPRQYVIGESQKVTIIGRGFSKIESIDITPSKGIEILQLEQIENKDDREKWSAIIVVKKDTAIGNRNVVISTPEGKSDTKTIEIIPYAPEIKELKIVSAKQEDCEIDMSLSVFYKGKELGDETSIRINFLGDAGEGRYTAIESSGKPMGVIKKDKGWYEIKDSFCQGGFSCLGKCGLEVTIIDKNGYEGSFSTVVDFGTGENK